VSTSPAADAAEAGRPFADVPCDTRGHLGLLYYAAAFQLIYYLRSRASEVERPLAEVLREHPFLESYFMQIRSRLPEDIDWEQSPVWLRERILEWERGTAGVLPLVALRQALGLSYAGTLAFVFAGLVEEQAEFGALFASIQKLGAGNRISLGLLQQVFQDEETPEAWALARPLIESEFLQVIDRDAPRSAWILRVPTVLWNAVRGECARKPLDKVRYHAAGSLEPLDEMLLDGTLRERLTELIHLATAGRVRAVILRGMPGTDRLGLLGALARGLGRGVMAIDCAANSSADAGASVPGPANGHDERFRMIGPLCTLTHSMPVFSLEAGPGETFEMPELAGYAGPVAVMLGSEGGVLAPEEAHAVALQVDLESPANRVELWKRALGNGPSAEVSQIAATLASTFCLPGRYIRQSARLASDHAAMERRQTVSVSDVRWAARAMNRQVLDTLATRVEGEASWAQLIVKDATGRELQILEGRCRHREQLASTFAASMPGGMNRGVRALFEGPSGTGKTLAARVLATELGLDLYRVDLAAVVNKYIGETEKNLSRVLSRAEDLNVVLLLDEGDALMTQRTDVKTANDRYANLETNYLLQRLEHYTGIVVVTTNASQAIDLAFRRRMDAVVKFHLPDAAERWRLWLAHLPIDHDVDPSALEEIARRYQLTGGQIRNVCVNAALTALSLGQHGLRLPQLLAALQAEHRKAGASYIESTVTPKSQNLRKMAEFVGGLS
jgi:ATPase family associated with various cellular activities (AAA)